MMKRTPTLGADQRPYLVTNRCFEVIEYATSAGAAALAVMLRYGLHGASARPVTLQ